MKTKSKRFKIKRGWNWKSYVISWLIKKIYNKKNIDQMWREINYRSWFEFFKRLTRNSSVERERKKKKQLPPLNPMCIKDTRYPIMLGVWRLFKHLSRKQCLVVGQPFTHRLWHRGNPHDNYFLIIFNKCDLL